MRRSPAVIAAGAVIVLGLLVWRWLFPPDEVLIRRRVEAAAATCSWEEGSGNLSRLRAASRLMGFCAPEVEVRWEVRGEGSWRLEGRDDLRQAVLTVGRGVGWLRVSVDDIEVTVKRSGEAATVLLAVTVRAEGAGEPVLQDYKLEMRKVEGEWLFARVEPVRGLGL